MSSFLRSAARAAFPLQFLCASVDGVSYGFDFQGLKGLDYSKNAPAPEFKGIPAQEVTLFSFDLSPFPALSNTR